MPDMIGSAFSYAAVILILKVSGKSSFLGLESVRFSSVETLRRRRVNFFSTDGGTPFA